MKQRLNRLIKLTIVLSILMLQFSCADTSEPENSSKNETETQNDISDASDNKSETKPQEVSDLPDEFDLEGYEFRIIKQAQDKIAWSLNLFGINESNGEVLNDAFYKRNQSLFEKYNFSITEFETQTNPVSTIRSSVLAGDDEYDAALVTFSSERNANDGTYYNLYDLPYLELDKSWWNQSMIEGLTINGKLYFISGDIIVSDDDGLMITVFSKALCEDYGFENLYDTVRAGDWTFDKKLELMKQVSADLNNDGIYDTEDRLGMLYADNAAAAPYFASADAMLFEYDNGILEFTAESERAVRTYEMVSRILSDKSIAYDWANIKENSSEKIIEMLDGKRVLFLDIGLHFMRRNLRDLNINFGVLPMPKLDENQAEYYNMMNESMTHIVVPASIMNPDKVGFILEALASNSGDITETYYKSCIESKYARDIESIEMLDIASENIVFDLGFIYNWGNLALDIRTEIVKGSPYASLIAKHKNAAIEEADEYIAQSKT